MITEIFIRIHRPSPPSSSSSSPRSSLHAILLELVRPYEGAVTFHLFMTPYFFGFRWYPVLGDAHTFQTTLAPLSAATAPDSQIDGVLHMLLHLHYILGQTVRNGKELILFGVLSPSSVDRF
uniref:Uncharacterized protein n=1 Tax=Lotharella oceanica TaxID=641309 RepID=A0A7S2TFG2_9EUKA|mmetsp:Transcript_11176/g.21425  ORF Transcript_11176/g.21425 Transcript_11176/m.21425 type:complete len:122 (+) Transcript_11176:201-566(+)